MTSKALRLSGLAKELDALAAASSSTLVVYEYTATANQTVFSGPDNNGLTLNYIQANTLVMYNEGLLQKTADYATTSTSVLTLALGAEAGALIRLCAFGTFAIANVYTKPEADALNYTKAQSDGMYLPFTAAKNYIDGLSLQWVGNRAVTVTAGSAYVDSAGKVLTLLADKVFTGLVLTGDTFYHLYLYDNAGVVDVECTTAVPARRTANSTTLFKTGTSTHRYLGTFLSNNILNVWRFRHDIKTNTMWYTTIEPSSLPFTLFTGYTGLGATSFVTQSNLVAPKQSVNTLKAVAGGNGSMNVAPLGFVPAGPASWQTVMGGPTGISGPLDVIVATDAANAGGFYAWVAGGTPNMAMYCIGYIFDR